MSLVLKMNLIYSKIIAFKGNFFVFCRQFKLINRNLTKKVVLKILDLLK